MPVELILGSLMLVPRTRNYGAAPGMLIAGSLAGAAGLGQPTTYEHGETPFSIESASRLKRSSLV
jgi:hypothetical protein